MKHIYLILLLALGLAGSACGSDRDRENDLRGAEQAVAHDDWQQARHTADILAQPQVADMLSASQLGRLALVYMQLAEQTDQEENTALGAQCFRRAAALSADSLNALFNELPLEQQRHFVLLRRLALSIDNPGDTSADDDSDGDPDLEQLSFGTDTLI